MSHLSVVVPVYNESTLIEELVKRIKINLELITEDFEIIIVDDGSQDKTWELIEIEAMHEERIKGLKFSRNFGHHYAITAGLLNAKGEWVVVMDGDLQDRPEVIPELYKKAKEGFDVVFVSRQNRPESFFYKLLQKLFYFLLNFISGLKLNSKEANFSIINRKVVKEFNKFPDQNRFYGSTIKWLGFKRTSIKAVHGKRFSGKPSYTVRKRVNLAIDILTSFSERPLRISIYIGVIFSALSLIVFIISGYIFLFTDIRLNEFIFFGNLIIFFSGILLTVIGISSIYIGKIFNETKKRSLFIISDKLNW
jgi:glycosyltransferase involved in cell wall biosynthesis